MIVTAFGEQNHRELLPQNAGNILCKYTKT